MIRCEHITKKGTICTMPAAKDSQKYDIRFCVRFHQPKIKIIQKDESCLPIMNPIEKKNVRIFK